MFFISVDPGISQGPFVISVKNIDDPYRSTGSGHHDKQDPFVMTQVVPRCREIPMRLGKKAPGRGAGEKAFEDAHRHSVETDLTD